MGARTSDDGRRHGSAHLGAPGARPDRARHSGAGSAARAQSGARHARPANAVRREDGQAITLSAGVTFYGIRNLVTNYLRSAAPDVGFYARLRPVRIADLRRAQLWLRRQARARRRAVPRSLGINLVGVYKQPPSDVAAQFTYAAAPVALILQTDTPVGVPEEYHESLIKFGLVWIRLREGGLELAKVMPLFAEFIADAAKLGAYVKARAVWRPGTTLLPFAMEHFDAEPHD